MRPAEVLSCRCGRPIRDQAQLCSKCTDQLEQDLAEVPGLLDELTTSRYGQGRGGGSVGVTSRNAERPLPFSDRPMERARELHIVLRAATAVVVEGRGEPEPRDLPQDLSRFLLKHLPWLRRRDEASEVHQQVTHAVGRLRGSVDPHRSELRSWGRCGSVEYDDVTGQPRPESVPCPAEVRAWRNARRATCDVCGTTHALNRERQDWLLQQARGELMYVAQLSKALELFGKHIADETIRSWVTRGQLLEQTKDERGRALYLVGHVIDLVEAKAVRQAELAAKREAEAEKSKKRTAC